MNLPTILCIVRAYDPFGNMVAGADVQAKLSAPGRDHGYTIPEQVSGITDEFGHCHLRLWPNARGAEPTNYKFTIRNPDSGKTKIVYAALPKHDVFLDEIATPNEGDWIDGGLGVPPPQSGGGTNNGSIVASTVNVGTTTTVTPGSPAKVIPSGTPSARVLNFEIPAGRDGEPGAPGLNGSGTIIVKQTLTGLPGTPATVTNTSDDPARAELVFTIPAGQPGEPVIIDPTTGVTITPLSFHAPYAWEQLGTTPTTDPGLATMDSATLTEYRTAISAAAANSKRVAAANAVAIAMGNAQRMIVRRNGVQIINADFTGPMTVITEGADVYLGLSALTAVAPIVATDNVTGTWTTTISGGSGFARTLTFSGGADAATTAADGFNPDTRILVPRSIDGIA